MVSLKICVFRCGIFQFLSIFFSRNFFQQFYRIFFIHYFVPHCVFHRKCCRALLRHCVKNSGLIRPRQFNRFAHPRKTSRNTRKMILVRLKKQKIWENLTRLLDQGVLTRAEASKLCLKEFSKLGENPGEKREKSEVMFSCCG